MIDYGVVELYFVNKEAVDLLKQMLEKNPIKRISAEEAIDHDFFHKIPDETNMRFVIQNIKKYSQL